MCGGWHLMDVSHATATHGHGRVGHARADGAGGHHLQRRLLVTLELEPGPLQPPRRPRLVGRGGGGAAVHARAVQGAAERVRARPQQQPRRAQRLPLKLSRGVGGRVRVKVRARARVRVRIKDEVGVPTPRENHWKRNPNPNPKPKPNPNPNLNPNPDASAVERHEQVTIKRKEGSCYESWRNVLESQTLSRCPLKTKQARGPIIPASTRAATRRSTAG